VATTETYLIFEASFTFMLPCVATDFFLITNQTHYLFKFIVKKLYMFRATSLPIIRILLLYIRHW